MSINEELESEDDEPIVLTPEEEVEEEMFALKMSAIFGQLNKENPDLPPLPIAYTAKQRQIQ